MSPAEPRPLTVFMTTDAVGGVWTYAVDAACGLKAHGVDTILAVLGPAPSADQREAARAAGAALLETSLPLDWTAAAAAEVEDAGRAVARLAAAAAPDIVHLNSPALGASADFPAPVVAVAHSCVATWWREMRGGPLPADFVWRSALVKAGYGRADAVVAPTHAFAMATARAYDLRPRPRVVRNGRRRSFPAPRRSDPFVFTAGRLWDEGKDIATLDRAAARSAIPVRAAGPCAGPNGARMHLSAIEPIGRLAADGVAHELAAQPIFVSSARYEPFGLAVLEAAQAGCALLLSDIPTFRELWTGAAQFFPPGDDGALADAIAALAADPAARARRGDAARARSASYSAEAMCRDLAHLYRSLAPARALRGAAA